MAFDDRPYEIRLAEMRVELVKLCKSKRIEITAALMTSPSALQAVVIFADLNNPAILEKYGLKPIEEEKEEEKPETPPANDPPINPLRN